MQRFILAMLVMSLATFLSCDGGQSASGDGKPSIAVIPKGTTHEFWKSVHAGARKAAEELGVEIIWKGPLKEDDRTSQITTVENFITRKVDAIVLAPLDNVALQAPVARARQAGIPVVIFDSALEGNDYVGFVATDNRRGGQLAGEHLAKLLGGKGKVVMLRYAQGSASTTEREQGFLDAIAQHPDIQVVSENQYGGATTETAFAASENLLAPYRNADGSLQIDGIFTPNESTTFGMLRALETRGWAGKVKFVGFDSSQKLVEGLQSGKIHGLVLQNPFRMGYLGVKTAVQKLRGESFEPRIDTGATLVTPDNMNEPDMQALLNPKLD
jgi:ribose transport system substrate-binding protein